MIYVVSGLPRSGTSMMMKMLEAGGLPVLVDANNPSTEQNPGGAYAYEGTKHPPYDWVDEAEGKAVKIIAWFIQHLPKDYQYKIIFMERDKNEVAISLDKLAASLGNDYKMQTSTLDMQSVSAKAWIMKQSNIDALLVDYNKLILDPLDSCVSIAEFLGVELNTTKMSKVPNSKLYRNRIP